MAENTGYNPGLFTLLLALGIASFGGCARSDDDVPTRPVTITLLHTNDTHSHLEPFPRDPDLTAGHQGPQQGGIARRKTLIDGIRAREPNVLLLDAGDNFQGTIFYNAWKGSAEIMALNVLGYDAVTLGNHEFDSGPAELGRALRGEPVVIAGTSYPTEKLRPPLVATNVEVSAEPALRGLLTPSVVIERGGESFGILGVVTQDVPTISSPGPNVRFLDAFASVQREADKLHAAGLTATEKFVGFNGLSSYNIHCSQEPTASWAGSHACGEDVRPGGTSGRLIGVQFPTRGEFKWRKPSRTLGQPR